MRTMPPDWAIKSAHRKANESGDDHALVFRISNVGGSDGWGGSWCAVRYGEHLRPGEHPDDAWMGSPYIAIAGELDPDAS